MLNQQTFTLLLLIFFAPNFLISQINEAYDDFEGNNNDLTWIGDNCDMDNGFANPFPNGINASATVLRYHDKGSLYANVRFEMSDKLDLSVNQTFSLKIYVPSEGITGNQVNQVSLKLQDGTLDQPWTTQSEIIKPITLDEWQIVTFDFENDDFINLAPSSLPPTSRSDFDRVLIQVNGENNNDHVIAYVDDILLYEKPSNDPTFDELVWSDEFDTDGPIDPSKWFHQTQIPDGGNWFNGEIQHYTDRIDNAFVENGVLKILAKKETFSDQGVSKDYTSARLNSKFAFTYGRVEIRAKLPTGVGTWPAMWMLGKNITETGAYWQTQGYGTAGWPACGEIDIMEHWGTNQDYISSAIHTPSSFGSTVNHGGQNLPNVSNEFHVYTLFWTDEKIVFSVDGLTHYTYNPEIKDDSTWPFDLDQYILLNVAILPSIAANFTESALEIDYIRVYQEGSNSTNELVVKNADIVYPNPFNEVVHIKVPYLSSQIVDVTIYNASGEVIQQKEVSIRDGQLRIDGLKDAPVGIYFVHYGTEDQQCSSKIIKQ